MSRPRHADPGSQATHPYLYQAPGGGAKVPPGSSVPGRRPGTRRLLTGLGLCVLILLLGELAKAGPVARLDLRADQHIAARDRSGALTAVAKLATGIGTPETVGIGLMILVPLVLRRAVALVLGGLYAVAVAPSRVYLGDHYPLDVLGGMLCALAAAFVVTGLAALPALQPWLRRLEPSAARGRGRRADSAH